MGSVTLRHPRSTSVAAKTLMLVNREIKTGKTQKERRPVGRGRYISGKIFVFSREYNPKLIYLLWPTRWWWPGCARIPRCCLWAGAPRRSVPTHRSPDSCTHRTWSPPRKWCLSRPQPRRKSSLLEEIKLTECKEMQKVIRKRPVPVFSLHTVVVFWFRCEVWLNFRQQCSPEA